MTISALLRLLTHTRLQHIMRILTQIVLRVPEPTGALDGETGDKVVELLLELQKEQGVTLIVVTHDLKLAERVGNIFEILGAPAL